MVAPTQAALQYAESLKSDLYLRLEGQSAGLSARIGELRRSARLAMGEEDGRTQKVIAKSDWLFDNNLQLKKRFAKLRSRIESVENDMGFYGAQEKYHS